MQDLFAGKIVLVAAALMLSAMPAFAQTVQMGPSQQRNTQSTVEQVTKIDPVTGKATTAQVTTNINLPEERKNPSGDYKYSGVPGKWMRQSRAEKAGQQEQKQVGQ